MGSEGITASNPLRDALSGGPPAVAASFDDLTDEAEITRIMSTGADVAELRIDRFGSTEPDHVGSVVRRFSAWPTLATIRHRDEGGDWSGDESQRQALFDTVLPDVDGIDVELAQVDAFSDVIETARQSDRVVVLSFHDFEVMPPQQRLDDLVGRAKAAGAEFVKISAMARSTGDVAELAALTLRRRDAGLITIAMGAHGSMSRVFFGALGSRLTYCAGSHHVSGQLSLTDTRSLIDRFYPH